MRGGETEMDMRATGGEKDSVSGEAEEGAEATAGEVICISFTPSREYREHVNRRYINERSYGATAGDSFWLGLAGGDVVDPFARYRDDELQPMDNPFWRARIEKAKADSARFSREYAAKQIEWSVSEVQDLLSIARGFDE